MTTTSNLEHSEKVMVFRPQHEQPTAFSHMQEYIPIPLQKVIVLEEQEGWGTNILLKVRFQGTTGVNQEAILHREHFMTLKQFKRYERKHFATA